MIGGIGERSTRLAQALYNELVIRTVTVTSTDTAEAVKLTENIFRSVNIALVNELEQVYAAMGIDIWEVIKLPERSHSATWLSTLAPVSAGIAFQLTHST